MNRLAELIKDHGPAVFFGGAGVSTESGIPDFRSADGIYSKKYGTLSPEDIISGTFFGHDPDTFFEYYRAHLIFPDAKPNRAHIALAALESAGYIDCVITQNIDSLHTKAGSKRVYELHGTVERNYCVRCGKKYDVSYVTESHGVPRCECGGIVRPDVTLYDEMLPAGVFEAAASRVARAGIMIVGGTSLAVYPAASLIRYFSGHALVVINYTPTPADSLASLVIHDSVGKTLDDAACELLGDCRNK